MQKFNPDDYFPRLLASTAENALTKPYYAELWKGVVTEGETPPPFEALPTITRAAFVAATAETPHSDDVAIIHHSTGTTGTPFFRHRTSGEIRYLTEFYSKLITHDHPGWDQAERPMVLSETDGYHGTPIPIPSNALVVHAQATNAAMLDQTIHTLTRSYGIARTVPSPLAITGTEEFILLITLELLRRGVDPSTLGIRALMTRGHYLSEERRKFFHQSWGIAVSDYFSLSEILGSAARSPVTRRYRFTPTVYAEFLDIRTGAPVRSGMAELVLTELVPFVTYEPLVRYRTGDLVEVFGDDTYASLSDFMPHGRIGRSYFAPDGTLLLAQYDLIEVLDAFPEIARTAPQDWVADRFGPVPLGVPRLDFRFGEGGFAVEVQPVFCAAIFQDAAQDFCARPKARIEALLADTAGPDAVQRFPVTVRATDRAIAPSRVFGR